MKPDKNSMDYQLNLLALEEMENLVPMTLHERTCIRKWVKSGHEIESNPWHYLDADGMPLNYLQAFRLKYGISQWTLELLERSGRTVSLG
ncbi:MAG: hypothetical protein ACLSG9_12120 [Eubacterium sp.]